MDLRVGYVGLGIMGKPMVMNLVKAGVQTHFYARRPEVVAEATKAGAVAFSSPQELAANSDVIIINVTDTAALLEVVNCPEGLKQGLQAGSVVIDMGTSAPKATRELACQLAGMQVDMLDAPCSGGEVGAIAGTVSIMVGGQPAVFERMQPIFNILGSQAVLIGEHGAGQVAKACNQIALISTVVGVSEAMQFAKAQNVDASKVREALLGGFASSRALDVHGQRILDNDYKAGFTAKLFKKDLQIALNEAAEMGLAVPGAAFAAQLLNGLVGRGQGELDAAALHLELETLNNGKN